MRVAAIRDIVAHARASVPEECCGLLIGTAERVESIYAARNLRRSATRYLVDPADHFAAIRAARQAGLAVVGAYHSHPVSPPVPSETDEREATGEEFLHLIVSPVTAETRAFRLMGGRLAEVALRPLSDG